MGISLEIGIWLFNFLSKDNGNNHSVNTQNTGHNLIKDIYTTGIIDFMIKSGFKTPIEAIPTPDLAVP
jgi:hypothetical protein